MTPNPVEAGGAIALLNFMIQGGVGNRRLVGQRARPAGLRFLRLWVLAF